MCIRLNGYTEQNIIRRRGIPYTTRIVSRKNSFLKKRKKELENDDRNRCVENWIQILAGFGMK